MMRHWRSREVLKGHKVDIRYAGKSVGEGLIGSTMLALLCTCKCW